MPEKLLVSESVACAGEIGGQKELAHSHNVGSQRIPARNCKYWLVIGLAGAQRMMWITVTVKFERARARADIPGVSHAMVVDTHSECVRCNHSHYWDIRNNCKSLRRKY